jgi:hypothetical protein
VKKLTLGRPSTTDADIDAEMTSLQHGPSPPASRRLIAFSSAMFSQLEVERRFPLPDAHFSSMMRPSLCF